MAVILRYFSEFGYVPGVLRKSSRSLSHLLMSSCYCAVKVVNKHIADLETDLSDGLRLIALIEVLSGKLFQQKYTRRPTLRPQKLENVTMALRFLERDEGIRIVNIGESVHKQFSTSILLLKPQVSSGMCR